MQGWKDGIALASKIEFAVERHTIKAQVTFSRTTTVASNARSWSVAEGIIRCGADAVVVLLQFVDI